MLNVHRRYTTLDFLSARELDSDAILAGLNTARRLDYMTSRLRAILQVYLTRTTKYQVSFYDTLIQELVCRFSWCM
jgi:hypothetical protein